MLERLTKQLENHQPKSNTAYIHWALVLVLAMSFTGWMVYQGVSQKVEAQSIPQSIRINYPTSGDLLLANSTYQGEYEVLTNTTSSGIEFLVKNPSGVLISIYTSGVNQKGKYTFVWDLTKLLTNVDFLNQGFTTLTLEVYDAGAKVYSHTVKVWRMKSGSIINSAAGPTDWQKPIPQQEFGSDQLALDLAWKGGNFAPPSSSGATDFYNQAHVLMGHFVNGSPDLFKIDEWMAGGHFGSYLATTYGVVSFLWSHIGSQFWSYTGGSGPTLGMQIISYAADGEYPEGRGTPVAGAIDRISMPLSSFVTWSAPVGTAGPVYPGAKYILKWAVNVKANPPSGLKADVTAYYNYDSVSKTWKSQVVAPDIDPVSITSKEWTIPTDVKLGSTIKFLITTKLSTLQGSVEYSKTNSGDLKVNSTTAPIELTSPTKIGTGPDNGVIKPKLVTLSDGKEYRSFTLKWSMADNVPANLDLVAHVKYALADDSETMDVGSVNLSDGSYDWRNPLEATSEKDTAFWIGKAANLVFYSRDNSFVYTSYPVVFGGRLTVTQPQPNEVMVGQPYTIKWTYPPAYTSQQPEFHQNTRYLQIHYGEVVKGTDGQEKVDNWTEIVQLEPSTTGPTDSYTWSGDKTSVLTAGKKYRFSFTWVYKLSVGTANAKSSFPAVDFTVASSDGPFINFTTPTARTVAVVGKILPIHIQITPNGWDMSKFDIMFIQYAITGGTPKNIEGINPDDRLEYDFSWTVPTELANEKIHLIATLGGGTTPRDSDPFSVISAGHTGDGTNPSDYQMRFASAIKPLFGVGETNSRLTDITGGAAAESNFSQTATIKYWLSLYMVDGSGQDKLIYAFPLQRSDTGALSILDADRASQFGAGVLNSATKIQLVVAFEITDSILDTELPSVTSVTINYSTDFVNAPFEITITPNTKTIDTGASADYTITVIPVDSPTFTGSVTLAIANPSWAEGQVAITFDSVTTNVPGGATLKLTSTTPGTYTFIVSATAGEFVARSTVTTLIVGSVTPPDGTVPQVNIAFTAPVQRGEIKNPDLRFTLALYEGLQSVYQDSTLVTDATDHGSMTIPSVQSNLELGKSYNAYIKTPQHLSQKASKVNGVTGSSFIVTQTINNAPLAVGLEFPELPAGDIAYGATTGDNAYDSWDTIDSTDWGQFISEMVET